MLLAYVLIETSDGFTQELCLVPEKVDSFARPVRIEAIEETDAGVFRIGPGESFIARQDPESNGLVIDAIKPARIYLTLDRPDSPGFAVRRVKIAPAQEGYRTYYQAEKTAEEGKWQRWEPLKTNFS